MQKLIGIKIKTREHYIFAQKILEKDKNSDGEWKEYENNVMFIDEKQLELLTMSGVDYARVSLP